MMADDQPFQPPPPKKKKGFANMSKERMREIAILGGKRAHELGTAHRFNSETAKQAVSKKIANDEQRKKSRV